MDFAGTITIKATRQQLWRFLLTPEIVTHCVPSLQQWQTTEDAQRFTADFILRWGERQVLFNSEVAWLNLLPLERAMMRVHGRSAGSTFTAMAEMQLSQVLHQMTQIGWRVEASITGKLANFPTPFIKTAALLSINKFFKNVKTALEYANGQTVS